MRIYQVYISDDMAESDSFYPTKKLAMAAVRDYGGIGDGVMQDDGRGLIIRLCFRTEGSDGYEVYLETHDITRTRNGICWALKNIPNR